MVLRTLKIALMKSKNLHNLYNLRFLSTFFGLLRKI